MDRSRGLGSRAVSLPDGPGRAPHARDPAVPLRAVACRIERSREYHKEARSVITLTDEECEALRKLEEELWREETRFDLRRMREIIAEDFFEFGMSGRFYRRED